MLLKGYQILMADGDVDDHARIKDAARECGLNHVFSSVYNGTQLRDYLFNRGLYKEDPYILPDFLIMDSSLSQVDGFDLLRLIRQKVEYRKMVIFVLTRKIAEAEKLRALDLGVDDYFQKPLSYNEWLALVRKLCSISQRDFKAHKLK